MEDEHIAVDRYGGLEKGAYFAVYDGHGRTFKYCSFIFFRRKRNCHVY